MKASDAMELARAALARHEATGDDSQICRADVWSGVAMQMAHGKGMVEIIVSVKDAHTQAAEDFHRTRVMRCWHCQTARSEVMDTLTRERPIE